MTKKIIVPTDFSENALTAARYSCQIAKERGYHLHLFHCYTSKTILINEINQKKDAIALRKDGDILLLELQELLQGEYPNLNIEIECRQALITDLLPKIATEPNYSLIILGSNGLDKNDSPLFGSTTNQIATQSRIPVIAVPEKTQFFQITKAAILTNFKEDELDSLKDFISIVGEPNELDIIHVHQISDNLEEVAKNITKWIEKIQHICPNTSITSVLKSINYDNEKQDSISEVVNLTIDSNNYDIVIVTKTRKTFFEKWFSRSVSKEVILGLETVVFFDNN